MAQLPERRLMHGYGLATDQQSKQDRAGTKDGIEGGKAYWQATDGEI